MKKILPYKIQKGDKIGIITPAGKINENQEKIAMQKIIDAGYIPVTASSITEKYGYLAGSDQHRANQINQLFANPEIKAIVAARGGYGCTRILNLLDYEIIKNNPKIIGGYSDLTALNIAIHKKTGLVTFHSSMLAAPETIYSKNSMLNLYENGVKGTKIICEQPSNLEENVYSQTPKVLKPGICKGTLIGGNLTLLENLIGTEFDISYYNKILFIEDINEVPYKIDRMLTHLKSAGKLKGIKGIIFGIFKGCETDDEDSLSLSQVIDDFIKDLDIPVVQNFTFGHIKSRCTFPIGTKVKLDTNKMEIKLLEDCVII
ncbi:MAG: LD-carboxypeptidase [Bacteroidales bacterium]|nr:LD-carboxypeptidase [Bacteroidales bacterium]